MKLNGYGVDAEFNGDDLTLTPTSRMGKAALFGPEGLAQLHNRLAEQANRLADEHNIDTERVELIEIGDSVRIPIATIERIELKGATRLLNGSLTVETKLGRKYIAHFRRRDAAVWRSLFEAIGSVRQAIQRAEDIAR